MARRYLDDVYDPGGVRVSIAVEPWVEGGARWRERLGARAWYLPFNRRVHDALARRAQRTVGGRWVVDVESDAGQRVRITRDGRAEAEALARSLAAEIPRVGLDALRPHR